MKGYPPRPSRPSAFEIKSTSITIDWSQSICDGGHIPKSFKIRYRRLSSQYFSTSSTYSYITVLDNSQRRYRFTGLTPSTLYEFSIQTLSFDERTSSYSSSASFSTLPPGKIHGVYVLHVVCKDICLQTYYNTTTPYTTIGHGSFWSAYTSLHVII